MVKSHKMKVTSFVMHVHKASIVILSKNHLLLKNVILCQSVKSVQSVKLFVQMVHSITLGFNIVKHVLLVIIAVQVQWLVPVLLVISVTNLTWERTPILLAMVVKLDTFVQKVKLMQWIVPIKRWVLLKKRCKLPTVKLANQVIFVLKIITQL